MKINKYMYIFPSLIVSLILLIIPAIYTIFLSFREWDLLMPPEWVGIENYINIFQSPIFFLSFSNSLFWVIGTLLFAGGLALLLSILINSCSKKFRIIYTVIFVAPFTLSLTVVSQIWRRILETTPGAINSLLVILGFEEFITSWLTLTQPIVTFLSIPILTLILILIYSWHFIGLNLLLFSVGLQSIPKFYREAAELDGANSFQVFYYIIFPMLKPVTLIVIANTIINSWRMFDIPWVVVGGGPSRMTETLAITMYRQSFSLFYTGEGAAIAVIIGILGTILSFRWLRGFTQ